MPNSDDPSSLSHERFADWVKAHSAAVRGYLRGVIRHEQAADDLLQETFRKAWEARDRYREETKARAYLLRIADRAALDYLRSPARRESLDPEALHELHDRETPPYGAIERSEEARALQQSLKELTEIQRRVLLLRFFGELEFAEIANETNLPLGTVLSHCRRGLERLRTLMKPSES